MKWMPFELDIDIVAHLQRMFDLTEELIRRGHSDADTQGIRGGSFARVLGEVWDVPAHQNEKRGG